MYYMLPQPCSKLLTFDVLSGSYHYIIITNKVLTILNMNRITPANNKIKNKTFIENENHELPKQNIYL